MSRTNARCSQTIEYPVCVAVYSVVNSFIASAPTPSTNSASLTMDSITIPYVRRAERTGHLGGQLTAHPLFNQSSIRDITFEQGLFTPNGLGLRFIPVPEGNFPQLGRNSFIKLNIALKEGRVYDIWKRARELWEESSRKAVEEDTLRELFVCVEGHRLTVMCSARYTPN